MMTFPTIAAGTRANEAIGGYANFVAYCNALAAGVDSVTTTAAGAALKANNLSDIASAETARQNLGLGTMATADASDYLSKAGNLGGIADLAVARTNLGLGTMATASASAYAALTGAAFSGAVMVDGTTDVVQLRVQGHSAQSNYVQTWENHAGAVIAYVGAAGGGTVGATTFSGAYFQTNTGAYLYANGATMMALPRTAAQIPFTARGVAAQTGNLFQAQNSSGTALANIYSDGSFLTPKIYVSSEGVGNSGSFGYASYEPLTGGSRINTSTQTNVALTVRNSHASASGKLQSWQVTTSDTEVASISAAGKVTGATATTSTASFRAPHGTAPTSPVDGDMWTTTAGLYVRINGATVGPLS